MSIWQTFSELSLFHFVLEIPSTHPPTTHTHSSGPVDNHRPWDLEMFHCLVCTDASKWCSCYSNLPPQALRIKAHREKGMHLHHSQHENKSLGGSASERLNCRGLRPRDRNLFRFLMFWENICTSTREVMFLFHLISLSALISRYLLHLQTDLHYVLPTEYCRSVDTT